MKTAIMRRPRRTRLAFIVSHPVQYYVPLYRRLAQRDDFDIKVFYTWHGGKTPTMDRGFRQVVQWDIPLAEGYDHEVVPNTAADPGSHHFLGLQNPSLVHAVMAWRPDAVHITGYSGLSHLLAMRALRRRGVPVLFRGDSHLLDERRRGARWMLKRALLRTVFGLPSALLYVGQANKAYYEAFGATPERLHYCPHSIDVARFAEPAHELEREAQAWRSELGIPDDRLVLLFAGKFERKKQPLELMRVVQQCAPSSVLLLMVGGGELENEVKALAAGDTGRFRVLPFQNQSRMPLVYRLGDVFVLPSAYGETWGLAVNEAIACGRPVIVSSQAGCAMDIVRNDDCGWVFPAGDWSAFRHIVASAQDRHRLARMRAAAVRRSTAYDVAVTESCLVQALHSLTARSDEHGVTSSTKSKLTAHER